MRVLIVVPWDQKTGGVASVVGNLARYLKGRGHSVTFLFQGQGNILTRKTTQWGFDGYELQMRAPCPGGSLRRRVAFIVMLPSTILQLALLVLLRRIDIVNVHFPLDGFVHIAILRRFLRIRLVSSIHGSDVFTTPERAAARSGAYRRLLTASDRVVAPSRTFRNDAVRLLPELSTRSISIHNGVDLGEIEALGHRTAERQNFILSVAAFRPCKGVDVLISAFGIARDRMDSTRLIIAGDGPLRGSLKDLSAELGLEERISFLGWIDRDEIVRLLRTCLLFVCPSRSESFGLVVAEALACGAPVIGTKIGGVEEIIRDGYNGLLVPPNEPNQLADAMTLILRDAELRESIAKQGPSTIRESFSAARNGAAYEELFGGMLRRGLLFPWRAGVVKAYPCGEPTPGEGRKQ